MEPEGATTFQVAIAWPIWAGGYPTVDEALAAIEGRAAEIVSVLDVDEPASSSPRVNVEFGPGDHRELADLNSRGTAPNSVLGAVRIDATADGSGSTDAVRRVFEAFVGDHMPGARQGANLYDVRVEQLPVGTPSADAPLVAWIDLLCAAAGRAVADRLRDLARTAGGLHWQRFMRGDSDTALLTRSTTLLALLRYDPEIAAVFEEAGLQEKEMASELGDPQTDRRFPLAVHADLRSSIVSYIARHPERGQLDVVDLAIAVVDSARDTATGRLGGRLAVFDVDADAVVSALEARSDAAATSVRIVEYAREIAGRGSRVGGVGDVLAAISIESSSYERSLLQQSVDLLYWRPTTDPDHVLVGLGAVDSQLREELDRAGVWLPLLTTIVPGDVADGDLAELVRSVRIEHRFSSDRASETDQLGITGEVNALSDVLVDREVAPPLAVGLFGRWGSGKSFFMDQMRSRIDKRTRDRPHGQQVLQIRFNAWHYADTSLWASLAVEIFERLADPEPVEPAANDAWLAGKGDPNRDRREAILKELETYRTAHAALEAQHQQLLDRRADLVSQRAAAQRAREATAGTRLRDVTTAVLAQPTVKDKLDGLGRALGVTPAIEELPRMAAELRTTGGYIAALSQRVRHPRAVAWLAAAFVVVLTIAVAVVVRADALRGWSLTTLLAMIAVAAGTVASAARLLRGSASAVNQVLRLITDTMATVEEETATQRAELTAEERVLEAQVAAHDEQIAQANAALADVDERIAAADAAVASLSVGQTLYAFLADRAAGYQRHLGIVGMLHRDFLMLDAQLRAFRQRPETDVVIAGYERIVLYIDDLDRCAPEKVLEVLEAVHLLLALPLFVVVVGVDPRWLKRSLRHSYRKLGDRRRDGPDPYLDSMPIEYLEKIFQIPFIVPPMTATGFTDLIASLAPGAVAAASADVVREMMPTAPHHEEVGLATDAPSRAALPLEPGAPAAVGTRRPGLLGVQPDKQGTTGARSVDLTLQEVAFAAELGPLVASPRAAKRLVNTYRLLRSTQLVVAGSRLLGNDRHVGEYQAMLTLLAIAAGFPAEAERVLAALERSNEQTWQRFVEALDARLLVTGALQRTLPITDLKDLEPFRRWGPVVARFTFSI